jgi:hypothetical protein
MKNLIIKWLGIPSLLDMVVKIKTEEAIKSFKDEVINFVIGDLNNKYDLDGLVSKFEDLQGSFENGEYRWDDMADKVEYFEADEYLRKDELKDKLSDFQEAIEQVQEIDDRLTQLVAGYRLDVQLIKEEF